MKLPFSILGVFLIGIAFDASSKVTDSEIENLCVSSAVFVRGAINDASIITSMLSSGQNQRAERTMSKLGSGHYGKQLLVTEEQYRGIVSSMVGDGSIVRMNAGGMDYSSAAIVIMSGEYEKKCMEDPSHYIINYKDVVSRP